MKSIRSQTRSLIALLLLLSPAAAHAAPAAQVLEAEEALAQGAEAFRDDRASGKKAAGLLLGAAEKPLIQATIERPPGDYAAVFWLEAVPAELLHHLAVTLKAGDAAVTLRQLHFPVGKGYQPYELRCTHAGGKLALSVSAVGGSGFDGMRRSASDQERADSPTAKATPDDLVKPKARSADELEELDEGRDAARLAAYDHRLLCDRIELHPLRLSPALVTRVEVDKVHYLPGETVKARVWVAGGPGRLVAEDVTEVSDTREVFAQDLAARDAREPIEFAFQLGDREFGHELRCSFRQGDALLHSRSEFFGVSRSVFRIGICGPAGPQDMRSFTPAQAADTMQAAKRAYANWFERFAWAPCDYSNLAPETEVFYAGQTQYPGSITGYRNLIAEAHKVGVKAITYGKACAGGIEGFKTFQRHPEFFGHRPEGPASEAMSVFYLERMLANDYNLFAKPSDGGWQHWASLWCDWSNPATVEFGAHAIIRSVEMFGWDGIRWDGHFVGAQKRFLEILRAKCPTFVHGYNIAFANPGSRLFVPPDTTDFHEVAANHGMLMDESVRDWSHSNFSPGTIRPFYEALCREADYEKRIGGLPLAFTLDMGSNQDRTLGVLCALAAGQRYCYITSPGDFAFGPLPKFLTRYSALVWDDTRRVANAEAAIKVSALGVPPSGGLQGLRAEARTASEPWWRESVWLRTTPEGRQQLLIHLLNPPSYAAFSSRVQTPPTPLADVALKVATPAGAKLVRAVHASPDLPEGHVALEPKAEGEAQCVVLPRLRTWSIVALDYEGGPTPLFAVTTPIEDAAAELKRREAEAANKKEKERAEARTTSPFYKDYEKAFNADEDALKGNEKPAEFRLARNGVLDLHHARGAFSWLNPLESAVALLDAGRYTPSWVDFVGFKLGAKGCMDEFPDTWDQLRALDVLALDDVHAFALGPQRRAMVAAFVRAGGGLLVCGGYWNLSLGADHNTALADLLPVRIQKYRDILCDSRGLALKAEKPAFFGNVDFGSPVHAYTVDTSPLKPGVEVLATAGGRPAIVAATAGRGRIITILMNPCGDPAPGTRPYWQWPQWPQVLAACVKWLGAGAQAKDDPRQLARRLDPTKPTPQALMMDAVDLDSAKFTARLREARANMVDAESARTLLATAVDNAEKIEDLELLGDVADRAEPYLDASFAPLADKLLRSNQDFLRKAGYQILGMAGDAKFRAALEKGLEEKNPEVARQALIGLGRLGDAAAIPAVERALAAGADRLVALTVLLRLGKGDALPDALRAWEQGLIRRVRLKCGRGAAMDTLWGGVSFKLTPAQRRQALAEYRKVLRLEAEVKDDVQRFADLLRALPPDRLGPVIDFLVATETREVVPLAFALVSRLPADRAKAYRALMAQARLPELRLLAAD
ncbi:MAG TPA: glutamine amidotransferase [Planctomycetota bacterium]|nr:glutamine amidotransferase [Planctomycetota bacterium]HRR78556.1 glutamine amidotransferase [Planctomycetota bacterium]